MSRSKKRTLLWVTGLMGLVVIGLAAYAYFMGTRALLEHAEAMSFRRMTVARLADQSDLRFFYATNRRAQEPGGDTIESTPDSVADRYTSEREADLKLGSFDTSIEPSIGLGLLTNPTNWFINEEIRLQRIRSLEQDAFVAGLREQVQASPRRSLLIVVHGFREAFPSALRKTAFLSHVLDINTPVLLFDWPGNQG